jgi:hypothetical protein
MYYGALTIDVTTRSKIIIFERNIICKVQNIMKSVKYAKVQVNVTQYQESKSSE